MRIAITAFSGGALLFLAAALAAGDQAEKKGATRSIDAMNIGETKDGQVVRQFTLTNASGAKATLISYGGILTELHVPDRNGKLGDVTLGFDNLASYLEGHPFFGCITGRYANRIARGKFTLDGKEYTLATNNGPHHLHGGKKGIDKVVWGFKEMMKPEPAVAFSYTSPDGDERYPGNLKMTVTYTLTDKNELRIDYEATTDKPTPVNLTNHAYFNLACAGDVLGHEIMFAADKYTPTDDTLIPTGEIKSVEGTPYDFRKSTPIGARIDQLKGNPGGYDMNLVLNKSGDALALAAQVYEPKSGRVMEMYTTEPGVQFYTANFLDGKAKGKGGWLYQKHHGFCLEAQHFPDSPNKPSFPSCILRPGQTYKQTTIYKFLTK